MALLLGLVVAGVLAGFLSFRMAASGKAALALGMVPLLALWLAVQFC